jgi:hypothetical protein
MPLHHTKAKVASLIGELKGAPASIILTMLLLGRPLRRKDFITYTRYSGPTIDKALDRLELLDLVQQPPGQSRYMLTVDAKQFILGEYQDALPEDEELEAELKNFYAPTKVGSSNNTRVLDLELDTPTLVAEGKKFLPDDPVDPALPDGPAQETADLLIAGGIVPQLESGKGAEDSVAAALKRGWDGQQCLDCVQGWLDYAKTSSGAWIQEPYALAAAQLRLTRKAPDLPPPPQNPRKKYISGKYADIIQH